MTTPLRSANHEMRDGVRLLRTDPDIPYRDGAEDRLWEMARDARDLRSEATEMLESAKGWAEQYHSHPARANILRGVDLPSDAVVLEIGSGCGPITRYLGETTGLVDSVEPVLPRARVGRERTRDLENVEVFCGNLEDVPSDPVYDVVVVVGVLEYVANGSPDPQPYRSFLQECRRRLRPGGSLVLAIENKLGVKYLTGTGEDHSGRIFDSIEDYPRDSPARTFSRTALLDLLTQSGFTPRLYGVFPDYKHTRVVLDTERLYESAPDLLENLPSFPSRFAGTHKLKLASEARVWRELARDGLGAHFANSFLVLCGTDAPARLWPEGRLAKYFSINRRPEYATQTAVLRTDDGVVFDRSYAADPGPLITDGMQRWSYVQGRGFLNAFYAANEEGRRSLLRQWVALVRESSQDGVAPLDAIPANLIETEDGHLALIDSEFHDSCSIKRVLVRGLFWLAVHITADTPPESWTPARTVGDVVTRFAEFADVAIDEAVVNQFRRDEAAFQVEVSTNYLGPGAAENASAALERMWDARIWDKPLGRRLHHDLDDSLKANTKLREKYDAAIVQRDQAKGERKESAGARRSLRRELDTTKEQLRSARRELKSVRDQHGKAQQKLASIQRSRAHRATEKVRRGVSRLRRLGSVPR